VNFKLHGQKILSKRERWNGSGCDEFFGHRFFFVEMLIKAVQSGGGEKRLKKELMEFLTNKNERGKDQLVKAS